MDIKPIRSDSDHHDALMLIQPLWGAAQGTPDGDRLDVLKTLVHAWENER
jgi:HTH-type transcriptional regulator/antitoxin HigA